MDIKQQMQELAALIQKQPKATHMIVRNRALVEAYVAEFGELPPGVTEVAAEDDPGVVTAPWPWPSDDR